MATKSKPQPKTIEVEFTHQTDLAILVNGDVWLPKSLLIGWDDEEYSEGETIEITAGEWLLKREGLI